MKLFLDANICLDMLDSTRENSKTSIELYMKYRDELSVKFYFSGDFITTIYYILTQRKKIAPSKALEAIDALCNEITPCYINHDDYLVAKNSFFEGLFDDFEDLIILGSANRIGCDRFITNDKKLLALKNFKGVKIGI